MENTNLVLYESTVRRKVIFVPTDSRRVTMYACGPTVYGYPHIGNFRSAVTFDLLFRVLRHHYGPEAVVYARNITDIDDKIIKVSHDARESIETITGKYSAIFHEETAKLNILRPNIEPTATSHVKEMVALVERLISGNFAYVANGHVLFSVARFHEYGRFSGIDLKEMLAGARVEIAPYKQNPADFVLWKPAKINEPGWESPWGRGRPGWHLECSAMIEKQLGLTIDLHGGGQDPRFPHHENEVAQSTCVHGGAPLARYWVHNAFVNMGTGKMSKSLGNVVLPFDLLKRWHGEVLRFALISTHYRQPLDWNDELLVRSKRQLDRFYRLIAETSNFPEVEIPQNVVNALNDDLNTPMAITVLHELRDIAAQKEGMNRIRAIASLKAAGELMGFFSENPEQWFKANEGGNLSSEEIDVLIEQRVLAKKMHDFATADQIRKNLANQGIFIEDNLTGTSWRRI